MWRVPSSKTRRLARMSMIWNVADYVNRLGISAIG